MRAFVLTERGPEFVARDTPPIQAGEALVRVHACALNRVDLMMAKGHVHGSAGGMGATLGVECAGEVVEPGPDASLRAGDRVMSSVSGAFAEFAVVSAERALPIPTNMSFDQAAALPVALQTMHDAIITNGKLAQGESVLLQGASSGVGIMGVQIARLFGAARVFGSSSDPERRARLAALGADYVFDAREQGWVEEVLARTEGRGVDLLVDQVAGPLANHNLRATRVGGRIVNVGRLGGMRAEFDFDLHAQRRIHYVGVTFRTRTRRELREVAQRTWADLAGPLADGRLQMPIDRVFPFEELPLALAHMRENRHFGKIVVRCP